MSKKTTKQASGARRRKMPGNRLDLLFQLRPGELPSDIEIPATPKKYHRIYEELVAWLRNVWQRCRLNPLQRVLLHTVLLRIALVFTEEPRYWSDEEGQLLLDELACRVEPILLGTAEESAAVTLPFVRVTLKIVAKALNKESLAEELKNIVKDISDEYYSIEPVEYVRSPLEQLQAALSDYAQGAKVRGSAAVEERAAKALVLCNTVGQALTRELTPIIEELVRHPPAPETPYREKQRWVGQVGGLLDALGLALQVVINGRPRMCGVMVVKGRESSETGYLRWRETTGNRSSYSLTGREKVHVIASPVRERPIQAESGRS